MDIKRRNFVKVFGAGSALLLPNFTGAGSLWGSENPSASGPDSRIGKSIKASFGGGFSVRSHARSAGLTYANIEHVGNQYLVASGDLLDWKIVSSDGTL